jgi:hydrophobe/amphiphile efflux-3 (HAE3) family protein
MTVTERFERLARRAARRPALTVAIALALAIAGALLSLGLKPSAGSDTFVSRSSGSFHATDQDHRAFGGDAVVILIKEPLTDLVETKDLATVTFLEACLAGQYVVANQQLQSFQPAPPGSHAPYGGYGSPCGKLMKARPAQVVYGPGTFLNRAVAAVNTQIQAVLSGAKTAVAQAQRAAYQLALGRHLSRKQALTAANAAGQLEQQQQTQQLERLYLDSGISGTPRIDDPQFIPQIVFDQTRGVNQPKSRFAYLFPTADAALIQVRLKASLSDAQQARAISWIRQAVKMPMFRSAYGGTYTVTGEPVVVNDLASQITGSIAGLLIAALLVMAATLLVVFRSRLRLLPLAIALAATGITFGVLSLVGGTLTMASIAVLPILIGLAVDYAIQFQSRAQEARRALGGGVASGEVAVAAAAAKAAPTIAAAALATATGFLVLLLSPVPMVRGFGLLLVVGIAIALACALTAGSAALVLSDRDGGALGASLRGAADILRDGRARVAGVLSPLIRRIAGTVARATRRSTRATRRATRRRGPTRRRPGLLSRPAPRLLHGVFARPGRVLAIGALLAVLGWIADTQTAVQSDVTKLVPSSMPALRDLHTLEDVTGVSGEIDVTVHANDVATPQTVGWMIRYEDALLNHYGYVETKGCAQSTLCPALSLPDLFSAGAQAGQNPAASLSQSSIRGLLAAVPSYFSQAVITPDHRSATLAFGIRLMPLAKQQRVIDYMSSQLHPPAGVTARLAGLPVLAAQAEAALSSSGRRLLTLLAGLIAVGLVLLVVFRSVERTLVPLVPIALATGWSALILFAIGIPLNPMSATLGALVIAISTEFSVLLSERFRQERAAGHELAQALARTYRSTGAAVLASGVTAIAGFGVLVLSSITMLREFGFVTLVDLSVSLAGVMLVLPAVLVVSERKDLVQSARGLVRRASAALPRLRRRARVA